VLLALADLCQYYLILAQCPSPLAHLLFLEAPWIYLLAQVLVLADL
jgi:hypothetical protein